MIPIDLKRVVNVSALNPIAGDLELSESGDLVWLSEAEEVPRIAQSLAGRLAFFKATWYLNQNEGIPYLTALVEKGVSDATWQAVFTYVVLGTPGIAQLDKVKVTRTGREIALDFKARTAKGALLTTADLGPFIVPTGLLG
jgi:hypothetical protein